MSKRRAARLLILVILVGCASSRERDAFEAMQKVERSTYVPEKQKAVKRPALPKLTKDSHIGDYLRYAALNNPGLEAAFNRWKAALERVPQAKALPDPKLTYGYFIDSVETRVGPQQHRVGVSQAFPWFGKLRVRGDVALAEARARYEQFEAAKLKLFYRVQEAYYEFYYLERAIAITRQNVELLKHFERVARSRYRVAAAEHADVIRAQVELGKLEDRLGSLQELKQPIIARLNETLNRPYNAPVPRLEAMAPESPVRQMEIDEKQILQLMRETNPELKALAADIEKERASIDLAKKDFFPDVTLGVDYIETGRTHAGMRDDGKDPVQANVSINLPLWLNKYEAEVKEARARHVAAQRELTDRQNKLRSDLKMALYKFRDAERKINLYRDSLVPKARQSLKATEQSYAAEKSSFLDLIDAQRVLLEFELAYERALANRSERLAELEMLIGSEIPPIRQRKSKDAEEDAKEKTSAGGESGPTKAQKPTEGSKKESD